MRSYTLALHCREWIYLALQRLNRCCLVKTKKKFEGGGVGYEYKEVN